MDLQLDSAKDSRCELLPQTVESFDLDLSTN